VTATYGHGFKGIHHLTITRDGAMLTAVVDERATLPFAPGTTRSSVAFQDGKPAPKFHVSAALRKAIRKFRKLDTTACAASTAALKAADTREVPCVYTDNLGICEKFPGCNGCVNNCLVAGEECQLDAIASAALCVFCSVISAGTCLYGEGKCADDCNDPGRPCCPVGCGNFCGPKGSVCCGKDACDPGECCGTDANPFCCGSDLTCVDKAAGLCCAPDHGDVCFNGNGCCPASASSCITQGTVNGPTCCPAGQATCGADDACCASGLCCHTSECCAAGQTCLDKCCDPADACGDTCCPSHNCLNGKTCCDPPDRVCGAQCCGPFTACCNGTCCPGQDVCIAGFLCCPPERACGNTCCPDGDACVDGACKACAPGQAACLPGGGRPTCCPTGDICCGDGECCDTSRNMTCCDVGSGPQCAPTSQCIK
jgi:hypothetical protein